MPQQETFFEQEVGSKRFQVLKSYDASFAREAFERMDEDALRFLSRSLDVQGLSEDDPDFADALWVEVEGGAREDWNTFSYFVVIEQEGSGSTPLFVSADWPSAEAFAKSRVV
jgi:hypothetical protein